MSDDSLIPQPKRKVGVRSSLSDKSQPNSPSQQPDARRSSRRRDSILSSLSDDSQQGSPCSGKKEYKEIKILTNNKNKTKINYFFSIVFMPIPTLIFYLFFILVILVLFYLFSVYFDFVYNRISI